MIGSADLQKAIVAAWSASTLNATFKALWPAGTDPAAFAVLYDQEAAPGQPFPYCVLSQPSTSVTSRSSGKMGTTSKRSIRDLTLEFHIHASAAGGKSGKRNAADLAEEVMKVFGGHPTVAPTGTLTLDNGGHLVTIYQTDYGVVTGDEECQWVVSYLFRIDVPVMV